jgi:hypothetical protein
MQFEELGSDLAWAEMRSVLHHAANRDGGSVDAFGL